MKLDGNGATTGKLLFGGTSASFKATFDANGDLTAALPPLMLHLHIATVSERRPYTYLGGTGTEVEADGQTRAAAT